MLAALAMLVPNMDETYRPQFHFTAQKGWLNDPNGLVYLDGEYHLFFQHNPFGLQSGNLTWGHAVSDDLLHWRQLRNAIEPDEFGPIWSGSAIVDWENVLGLGSKDSPTLVAFYTAAGGTSPESQGQPFTQRLVTSTNKGRTWVKHPANPILKHIVGGNRDPKVVRHEPSKQWVMALYLDGSTFGLFGSKNLLEWTELQRFDFPGRGECPDFFEMPIQGAKGQKRWVFTSANGNYLVGSFDGKRFQPETEPQVQDHGPNHYAVQTFSDIPSADGRRIQIAWMNGGHFPDMPFNQQMGIPSELTLRKTPSGLRLFRVPVREVERLRGKKATGKVGMPIDGELLDIELILQPNKGGKAELNVRGLVVTADFAEGVVGLRDGKAPMADPAKGVQLRVLVDRTSLEVFVDEGFSSLSACFLPETGAKTTLSGEVKVKTFDVWPMASVWKKPAD